MFPAHTDDIREVTVNSLNPMLVASGGEALAECRVVEIPSILMYVWGFLHRL